MNLEWSPWRHWSYRSSFCSRQWRSNGCTLWGQTNESEALGLCLPSGLMVWRVLSSSCLICSLFPSTCHFCCSCGSWGIPELLKYLYCWFTFTCLSYGGINCISIWWRRSLCGSGLRSLGHSRGERTQLKGTKSCTARDLLWFPRYLLPRIFLGISRTELLVFIFSEIVKPVSKSLLRK